MNNSKIQPCKKNTIRNLLLLNLLLIFVSPNSFAELLLFSDDSNEFLGCLDCSAYSSDSICNEYGLHGNEYSSKSIWNEYGTYGSKYSSHSPWNEYSGSGPKIVDRNGNYYGRFSINQYSGFNNSSKLNNIYEIFDEDLDKVRNAFCH